MIHTWNEHGNTISIINQKTICYKGEVFHSEEELQNFQRGEKLDYLLKDKKLSKDKIVTLEVLPEYDRPI